MNKEIVLNSEYLEPLIRILDNSLDNYELFTDVNVDDDEEFFDNHFHKSIVEIRNELLKIKEKG
jgi:hypothetical protein